MIDTSPKRRDHGATTLTKRAGGTIAKPAQSALWGGYFGDRNGNLWKVVSGGYEVDGVLRETDEFSE
jgi:hypothetical protein